ncbi:hypothetical protein BDZ97DRAFT_1348703 [Flammula alnicola]|nr:hypothetical protein BDZ97DRAFT_1348703 [Flammula alnicola]
MYVMLLGVLCISIFRRTAANTRTWKAIDKGPDRPVPFPSMRTLSPSSTRESEGSWVGFHEPPSARPSWELLRDRRAQKGLQGPIISVVPGARWPRGTLRLASKMDHLGPPR